jgi:hypothetical protein
MVLKEPTMTERSGSSVSARRVSIWPVAILAAAVATLSNGATARAAAARDRMVPTMMVSAAKPARTVPKVLRVASSSEAEAIS